MRAISPLTLLTCIALAGCVSNGGSGDRFNTAATVEVPPERQVVITIHNAPTRTALNAGSTLRGYDAAGRYQASPAALRDAAAIGRSHGLRQLAAWPIELLGVHCIVFAVPDSRSIHTVVAQLAADDRVESAQPLRSFRTHSAARYDDPYLGLQSNLSAMQVEDAHRWSRGRGVRIAVVDSGVDDSHPDLANRVVFARDVTGLTAQPARLDIHGTAVAGVIGADAGNGQGIVGVAPEASILALRACWQVSASDASGAGASCNTFTLAQAIALAISGRADVINLSLSGPPDPLLERLLRQALAMGKIVVCAVPEADEAGGTDIFPASLAGVLAVASAETRVVPKGIAGVLYAPGRNVLTLRPKARYDFEDGSSMAAANVSGVVALLKAVQPDITAREIRVLLSEGADRVGPVDTMAQRTVNACHALAALSKDANGCAEPRKMRAARP